MRQGLGTRSRTAKRVAWTVGVAAALAILSASGVAVAAGGGQHGHRTSGYYAPAYVIVPAAPVRTYAPAPVYYGPPPVVYGAPPVYAAPVFAPPVMAYPGPAYYGPASSR